MLWGSRRVRLRIEAWKSQPRGGATARFKRFRVSGVRSGRGVAGLRFFHTDAEFCILLQGTGHVRQPDQL